MWWCSKIICILSPTLRTRQFISLALRTFRLRGCATYSSNRENSRSLTIWTWIAAMETIQFCHLSRSIKRIFAASPSSGQSFGSLTTSFAVVWSGTSRPRKTVRSEALFRTSATLWKPWKRRDLSTVKFSMHSYSSTDTSPSQTIYSSGCGSTPTSSLLSRTARALTSSSSSPNSAVSIWTPSLTV